MASWGPIIWLCRGARAFSATPLGFTRLPPGPSGRAARQDRRRNWLQQGGSQLFVAR